MSHIIYQYILQNKVNPFLGFTFLVDLSDASEANYVVFAVVFGAFWAGCIKEVGFVGSFAS